VDKQELHAAFLKGVAFFFAILYLMKRVLVAIALFALPTLVLAAGFAKQTIFLSTNTPVEGQTVLIHASVSNPTAIKFTGKLNVRDASVDIGSVPVTLEAGAADDAAVSWKPASAGLHTIVATLMDATGATVEEDTQVFSIAEKTSTDGTPKSDVQPSTGIQQSLGNISPIAAQYSAPVFRMIDSGRTFAANELNKGIDWSKQQLGVASKGTTTPFTSTAEQTKKPSTFWVILATAVLYILSVLLYLVSHAGAFYPILAILFFWILWKCFRRFRRR
jgi:hypothetical protein